MSRLAFPHARAFAMSLVLVGGAGMSAPSLAQSVPATNSSQTTADDTIRLTDEQRNKILDENTEDSAAAARGELTSAERAQRGIHGEVGVMVGSNGTRGAYGAADIPLGDNASASVAVESSRFRFGR